MGDVVLKIEDVSKQYRLGLVGTGSLVHDVNRWWHTARGKEDPYLKIGDVNVRDEIAGEYVWALQNINMEVEKGDVFGIIGKNGAGKSTLLKLLSQVTAPTIGSIKVKGRIAALLEVGTGFHKELTGKENIYLNGAILGMNKSEIKSKIDEIIEFSGVAKYIDTPVKRYSSGMMVRLGFSVAAHLEPEILVVDEVLAVGDVAFQKKCLGKMQDVAGEGRTVLFVSHNMASIKTLCTKGIVLENGAVSYTGSASGAVEKYLTLNDNLMEGEEIPEDYPDRVNTGGAFYRSVRVKNDKEESINRFYYREPITIETELEVLDKINDAVLIVRLTNSEGLSILHKDNTLESPEGVLLAKGKHKVNMRIDLDLIPGEYRVELVVATSNGMGIDRVTNLSKFNVEKASLEVGQEYRWTKPNGFVTNTNEIKVISI